MTNKKTIKVLSLLLVCAMMIACFAGCGSKTSGSSASGQGSQPGSSQQGSSSEPAGSSSEESDAPAEAVEVLNAIWAKYDDKDKFAIVGGDSNENNQKSDAPGKFGTEDAEAIDSVLGFPESSLSMIDDAASMIHMMNANTFTCGVFRLVNQDDAEAVVGELKDNILGRQWMCGFPDKLIIMTVDNYIISVFGNEDMVSTFRNNTVEAYSHAVVQVDEAI